MPFRQKHGQWEEKLIRKWVGCIKENGLGVSRNEMSHLSGVHLTVVTHKSIDDLPSDGTRVDTVAHFLLLCRTKTTTSLTLYLKMNPRPENELLIAVPVGRACPHNVCKQIYVPTVTGTSTTDTYLLAAEKKQLNWEGASWSCCLGIYCWLFLGLFLLTFVTFYTYNHLKMVKLCEQQL